MIDRSIKWPLILGVVCALAAIFVMVRLLEAELPLDAAQDPAALSARVLATLSDTAAVESRLRHALAAGDRGIALWMMAAIAVLAGMLVSAKMTAERVTLRRARRRRRARLTREIADRLAAEAARV